jgi:hypothetical protein
LNGSLNVIIDYSNYPRVGLYGLNSGDHKGRPYGFYALSKPFDLQGNTIEEFFQEAEKRSFWFSAQTFKQLAALEIPFRTNTFIKPFYRTYHDI